MASCKASPRPGTILKAPGMPWGPLGGGGGAGAMPPPGGGGGGGGGILISRPFFYSGGIFDELANGVRHSSDCCPERHEKPGCCRCPGTLKARCWQDASASACSASHTVISISCRDRRSWKRKMIKTHLWLHLIIMNGLNVAFCSHSCQWESSVGIVATWKATVMSGEILSVDKALMFRCLFPPHFLSKHCVSKLKEIV